MSSCFARPSSWLHSETKDCPAPQSLFHTLIDVFFQLAVLQSRSSFSFLNQCFTLIQLFESHNRSKFFGLGRRWFHTENEGTVARARATVYLCVFHLYKQSSSDNSVAVGTKHAAIFLIAAIKSSPVPAVPCTDVCIIWAATKIARMRRPKRGLSLEDKKLGKVTAFFWL